MGSDINESPREIGKTEETKILHTALFGFMFLL